MLELQNVANFELESLVQRPSPDAQLVMPNLLSPRLVPRRAPVHVGVEAFAQHQEAFKVWCDPRVRTLVAPNWMLSKHIQNRVEMAVAFDCGPCCSFQGIVAIFEAVKQPNVICSGHSGTKAMTGCEPT